MRVLALAKNLDSLVISEVFRGVGDAAADSGYVSLIAATDGDLDREQQLVDMLRNGSVDGLVIFSPTMPDEDVNAVAEQLSVADGAIVGTYFKADGVFENKVDRSRVKELTSQVRDFRRTLA